MAVTRPAALTVLAAALFSAAPAWAQNPIPETVRMMEPHRLRIGDYVRAWPTVPGSIVQGPVVAVSSTTVTIAGREEAVLVDLQAMSRMEVRRVHQHVRRGALIGAGVGLVASAFVATRELLGHEVGGWERAAWMGGLTAGGALAGTGVGRLARSTTWQPVDLVTLKPQPRTARARPTVRLAWTFRF
ncbi:MAG TPA: hypothetical protein VFT38_21125 [Vicinamibacteria bacterium]|nr:hypothetical protein [Vicinamibacteria bacterium]